VFAFIEDIFHTDCTSLGSIMFNATLAGAPGGTSHKYQLRADYLRDSRGGSRANSRVDLNHVGTRDSQQLRNELEARVGLMGGDSLEEADKSWWERNKSWITILIFVLIILATIIVIVFIGFGGLNAT